MVLAAHLVVVWLFLSLHQISVKTRSGSLQLVWIPRPALLETAPEHAATKKAGKTAPRHLDHAPPPSITPPVNDDDHAISSTDWNEELQLAAKNALANASAQKRHEFDFAHAYPTEPKKPPQFAWDYAATHRIEALPEGGILLHLNDNCVLLIFPLPFIGCGIGKRPVNGDLFEHISEK